MYICVSGSKKEERKKKVGEGVVKERGEREHPARDSSLNE
jgi:hypothetical protein